MVTKSKTASTSASDVENKYVKLDQREHVLHRPGMYIGSIEPDTCETWVFEPTSEKMVKKPITYTPGLFKIFDEILVNAIDHSIRLKTQKETNPDVQLMKHIKVSIDKNTGIIEVLNDGDGIEVVQHPEHKIYIPQLIFGNLLTSSNYDDNVERTIGGCNGVGSKGCNIFSEFFEIETVDRVRKLQYLQKFEKNMTIVNPPNITKFTKKPYTCIRFKPDYKLFNMSNLTDDMHAMFMKRVYDACAVTDNDITIYLNEVKLDYKNFEKYVDLYIGSKSDHTRVYEQVNDRWEVIASYNDFNGFDQVSFVNGIWTLRGGKHVEYILNQIVKRLSEMIAKKNKNANVKPQNIKDNLILFVKSTIINPTFDSQSKETLTTPFSKFGSKAELSDKFIEKLYKTGIADKIMEICEMNNNKDLAKTDGKKRSVIKGIPKLDDANWAGTAKSKECTLILTEGDSAKTMVVAGLSQVGRDKYGVFPLKGKLMNVRDTSVKKIMENEEITNLKKIIGLETNKKYTSRDDLRYGKIMVLTDQDSVTFDTPCLVKNKHTQQIDVKPICELYDGEWMSSCVSDKQYNSCDDYLVWSDKGWTGIKHVMKHRVSKPIYRVLTHTGCVDVTEDHSLVAKDGREITVNDCVIKSTELLHNRYEQENVFDNGIHPEYAYALGYFMADGSCSTDNKVTLTYKDKKYHTTNSSWEISCVEQEPLIRLKEIFDKYETDIEVQKETPQKVTKFQCEKCNKYFKDNYALRCHSAIKSDCSEFSSKRLEFEIVKCKFSKDAYSQREFIYKLQAKVVRKPLCEKFRRMFYNSLREKKVPSEILNAHTSVQQAFIEGFYAGDGKKSIRTTDTFDGEYKCQMMGLFHLLQNCGYTPSINCPQDKLNVYKVLMGKERGKYWRPECTIKKIIDVSHHYQDTYVYDFETENHHFHAGIGNMIVHNCDGAHIRGLLFNLFNTMWPSLFQMEDFIVSMLTPIIKATHNKKKQETISFYCLTDYDNWKKQQEETNALKEWKIKYYKGLGTSTNEEAKQYFKDLKIVTYKYDKDSDFCLDLAFNKSRADDRKLWLSEYNREDILDYSNTEVKYEDFINKELIHFSNYDLERSIPSMVDGFKVSQRKVLFGCFKKNLTDNEIRVAQLASYVSENACYHHGEASLQGAITAMAQNFVGANNINLLKPNGQFGSRNHGGKDASAPRYIYTLLEKVTQIIFNKQDNGVLKYLDDDGIPVEPEYYVPIIPMILVNGAVGIGTGFSTNIPCFNPKEIVNILKQMLQENGDIETMELKPWYMGFTGTIELLGNGKYVSRGRFQKLSATKVEITELPVGTWTEDFKELLEQMLDKDLKQYESYYTDKKVSFILHFANADTLNNYLAVENNGHTKLENDYKLVSAKNLGITNMYLYNSNGQIQKYDSPLDIIHDFYRVRLSFYTKRKENICKQLEEDMEIMRNKIRFIRSVISNELVVSKMKKSELEEHLSRNEYLLVNETYDYLLRIPIYNLTIDKVEDLEKEFKQHEENLNNIKSKSEKAMWLDELTMFDKAYDAFLAEYQEVHADAQQSTSKSKQVTKPRRIAK